MGTVAPGAYDSVDALDAGTTQPAPEPAPQPDSGSFTQVGPLSDQLAASFSTVQPGLYVTLDDTIVFTAWNSVSTLPSLSLLMRVLKPDGTLVIERMTIGSLTANRVANSVSMSQLDGFLVSVIVSTPAVAVSRGQCFVRAQITRGGAPDVLLIDQLLSDYVTTGNQPQWPDGRLLSGVDGRGYITLYTQATANLGLEIALSQPTGVRWRVLAIDVTLTTGATAGNRTPGIVVNQQGQIGFKVSSAAPVPANTQAFLNYAPGMPLAAALLPAMALPLPIDFYVSAAASIDTFTTGLVAGDVYSLLNVLVEEWIDV